jgi:hypothetical protein
MDLLTSREYIIKHVEILDIMEQHPQSTFLTAK